MRYALTFHPRLRVRRVWREVFRAAIERAAQWLLDRME